MISAPLRRIILLPGMCDKFFENFSVEKRKFLEIIAAILETGYQPLFRDGDAREVQFDRLT